MELKHKLIKLKEEMSKYVFKRYYKCSNGEIDDENVWVRANGELEANSMVRSEYPNSTNFILLRVDK